MERTKVDVVKVQLRRKSIEQTNNEQNVDDKKCIICQTETGERTNSSLDGRKRILDAAKIPDDFVNKCLKLVDKDNIVYHVNNECYKQYTLKKTLEKLEEKTLPVFQQTVLVQLVKHAHQFNQDQSQWQTLMYIKYHVLFVDI